MTKQCSVRNSLWNGKEKICSVCGNLHNRKEKICIFCEAISLGHFWIAKDGDVTMYSDGDQFIAQIRAGIDAETYMSVGYSCPNHAGVTKKMIPQICMALDEQWEKIEKKDLNEMLPDLYELCRIANRVYNKLLMVSYKV